MAAVRVMGVDACPAGWVGVELDGGVFARVRFAASLRDLLDLGPPALSRPPAPERPSPDEPPAPSGLPSPGKLPAPSGLPSPGELPGRPAAGAVEAGTVGVVAVDMPLGLFAEGWRECDRLARIAVGPRRASVFLVPPRPVWLESEFAAANALCRALTGAGLTRQAWGLRTKVLEADELRAERLDGLFEVHPELAFRTMAGEALAWAKTTWAGAAQRRALLAGAGIVLPDDLGPANAVPPVDVLDAAAVAWSAHRIATGTADRLPGPDGEQLDDRGIPTAIWF